MCGRFALDKSLGELCTLFKAGTNLRADDWHGSFNIGATMSVPVLIKDRIGMAQWGFPVQSKPVFNARSETVAQKQTFQDSWHRLRRCIIPANGFYEWQHDAPKGQRQPYLIFPKDNAMFYFAGLWQKRADCDQVEFTILTKQANEHIESIHPRMPVILGLGQCEEWFAADSNTAHDIIGQANPVIDFYKVDPRVGNIRNNDAALVQQMA